MNRYSASVRWSEEDHAFVAVCPELNDLSAVGPSAPEAVEELATAIELALEAYREEGWPIPDPAFRRTFSGQFRVRLPRSLHGWLVGEAEREGVSLNSFVIGRLSEARGARSDPKSPQPERVRG